MKNIFRSLIFLFCFLEIINPLKAQDSLTVKRNQIYIEGFGNNFPGLPLSINYSRKFPGAKRSFIVFLGAAAFNLKYPRFMYGFPVGSFNAGLLFRGKYKSKGLWGSVSAEIANGNWGISTGRDINPYNGNSILVITEHSTNFCVTPALVYQLQILNEKNFLRISAEVKISSGCFAKQYRDVDGYDLFYPSVGICIGGGFNPGDHSHHRNEVPPAVTQEAQKLNQIYVELLGNNFFDSNASEVFGFASINYARKLILKQNSFILSAGIGPIPNKSFDPASGFYQAVDVDFPFGIIWRPGYSRKGYWIGFSFTPLVGKIGYRDKNNVYYLRNSSFQCGPDLTYQYQSKSENFFIRFSLTPKIYANAFNKNIRNDDATLWPFWFGISIGGGS